MHLLCPHHTLSVSSLFSQVCSQSLYMLHLEQRIRPVISERSRCVTLFCNHALSGCVFVFSAETAGQPAHRPWLHQFSSAALWKAAALGGCSYLLRETRPTRKGTHTRRNTKSAKKHLKSLICGLKFLLDASPKCWYVLRGIYELQLWSRSFMWKDQTSVQRPLKIQQLTKTQSCVSVCIEFNVFTDWSCSAVICENKLSCLE